MGLAENILMGDEKSAARLITMVEDGSEDAYADLARLLPHTGRAHIIGITGPPGAGKSTVTGHLAVHFSQKGRNIGIIATDPTAMKGTGAILGDRLRMKEAEKNQVFIRSMAHRTYPGGIARATAGAIYILEGLGKNIILLESLGAGQSEKGLYYLCDTIITIFTPDYGDEIQLLKAGLLEIGDIIVVNKSDKPAADEAVRDIQTSVSRKDDTGSWNVPVILTRADRGEGMESLIGAVEAHWQSLLTSGKREESKKEKIGAFLMILLKEELWRRFIGITEDSKLLMRAVAEVHDGRIDPYSAVDTILQKIRVTVQNNDEDRLGD